MQAANNAIPFSREKLMNQSEKIFNHICPICNCTYTEPFFKTNTFIQKCINCGMVFDTKEALDQRYYKDRQHKIKADTLRARTRNIKQRLKLLKKYLHGSSLLDIGCGEGTFLKEVQSYITYAKGIEPDFYYANSAQILGLDVIQGFVEDIKFPPNSFDIVTMFHVLEHFQDPSGVLKKIYLWLKPCGLLVIEVPNIASPYAKYKGEGWELITPEHKFYFSHCSLNYLLKKYSFDILDMKTRDFDQYRIAIGKNLRKLGINFGKPKPQKPKKPEAIRELSNDYQSADGKMVPLKRIRRTIQLPLKAFLGWLVLKFNRGDHLFVIARKSEK